MGGSSGKIKVAIIDENDKKQDFQVLGKEEMLKVSFYKSLQQFLENQSLKKLSYIIIREKQSEQRAALKDYNTITIKKIDNINQLNAQFSNEPLKKNITVREKLIAYIRKFSLEKLVIYLLVKNVRDYKVPDYEAPYLTLISDQLQVIIDHVKTSPKREQPAIFKFKRMVKDLYRRTTVRIIEVKSPDEQLRKQYEESEAQWKKLMSSKKLSFDFSYDITSFQQSLISNYSDFIIVSNSQMLTYILDAKKQYQFDSKVIYFGMAEQVQLKKNLIWMISNGRTWNQKKKLIETIKNCSDVITDKSSARPKQTIIYTTQNFNHDEKEYIMTTAIQKLKKTSKQQDKKWIDEMHIIVTSNYDRLKGLLKDYIFTYIITFDCTVPQNEELKVWLKKNGLSNRVYIYNLQTKDNKRASLSQDKDHRMQKISKDVETMVLKAGFKIKFEVGPLQQIAIFQMNDKQYRYFSSKIGLMGTKIDQQTFAAQYCKVNRVKIVDNYHIVCNVNGYLNKLKRLIDAQIDQSSSYFKDLRMIIYDKKQTIKQRWKDLRDDNSIAFVHYNFTKIQDFLDLVFVPSLRPSIFLKKSLPQYMESLKNLEESRSRNLSLKRMIVSKNNLLKEVFQEIIITGSRFDLAFKHYSITNRNLQQSIQTIYKFVDRFANLWRIGYNIINANQDKRLIIDAIRSDIKSCLYKCKSYSLLEVSDQDFDYFYLKRLDICQSFLDLQITTIYITTLPHGFNKILEQILSRPKQNSMIPKVFSSFIVILLTAFCSVEDRVMSNKSLVVYIDDDEISSKMGSLNIGDILFNTNFLPSSKNQDTTQNELNHCLFIQFEDIPMLSESFIKNYVYTQRFSFYKQSSQYLIAPYTQFRLKNKLWTSNQKYHLYLQAVTEQQKSFPHSVLRYNSIDDKQLFNTIKQQIDLLNDDLALQKMTQDVKSLYKKSQIISLYEQKRQMVKSINDSLQYKNFLNAINKEKYISALNHLNYKSKNQKMTTQLQAQYFKAMLSVQRSLLCYKLNQFDQSIKELNKVQTFLENEQKSWVKSNISKFKESMNDVAKKRNKLFNRAPKVKKWKIYAEKQANNPQKTSFTPVVVMKQEQYTWSIEYLKKKQENYMISLRDPNVALLPYIIKQSYGEPAARFTDSMIYEKTNTQKLVEQQNEIKGYFKFKVDPNFKQNYQNTNEIRVRQRSSIRESPTKRPDSTIQLQQDNFKSKESFKTVSQTIKPKSIEMSRVQLQRLPNIFESFEHQQEIQPTRPSQKLIKSFNFMSFGKLLGITQTVSWQSFYYGDRFVLTKKGKHFKGKLPNKIQ